MTDKYMVFVNEENMPKEKIDVFFDKWNKYCDSVEVYKILKEKCEKIDSPQCVMDAYKKGMYNYVCDYIGLKEVFYNGGLYMGVDLEPCENILNMFDSHIVCCVDKEGRICDNFVGGDIGSLVIKQVLDSYCDNRYKDQLAISLGERVEDVLRFKYGIVPTNKTRNHFESFKILLKEDVFNI
jgi:hypothetical protein